MPKRENCTLRLKAISRKHFSDTCGYSLLIAMAPFTMPSIKRVMKLVLSIAVGSTFIDFTSSFSLVKLVFFLLIMALCLINIYDDAKISTFNIGIHEFMRGQSPCRCKLLVLKPNN